MDLDYKDTLNLINLQTEHLENAEASVLKDLSATIKNRIQYYAEENVKLQAILRSVKLLNEELNITIGSKEYLEKLCEIQKAFETTDLGTNSIALSHADRLRKHSNYLSKIKVCIKMYVVLNEGLTKKLKTASSELKCAKHKIDKCSLINSEDIKGLEKKVSRYENELAKFEKKYPWLADSKLNLPNIMKETFQLTSLREEKEKLEKELSVYQNLKPNIQAASQQLADLKIEHEEITNKLFDSRK